MKTRFLALLMAAVMLLSAVPVYAADPAPTFVVDSVTGEGVENIMNYLSESNENTQETTKK